MNFGSVLHVATLSQRVKQQHCATQNGSMCILPFIMEKVWSLKKKKKERLLLLLAYIFLTIFRDVFVYSGMIIGLMY